MDGKDYISKKIKIDTNGCWIWQGSLTDGYGQAWVGGKNIRAHRFSWELENGPRQLANRCRTGLLHHWTLITHESAVIRLRRLTLFAPLVGLSGVAIGRSL